MRWAGAAAIGKEIIALVVHEDEGRKVLHLNAPDGFHAEFGIFKLLNLLDVFLGEDRGRSADAAQIKAAMFLAGLGYLRAAIALGQHDH